MSRLLCLRSPRLPASIAPAVLALVIALAMVGCGGNEGGGNNGASDGAASGNAVQPELTSRADSVAMRMLQYHGGGEAWPALPHLRFNFSVARNGEALSPPRRHLWDRTTGRYRLEWQAGSDSNYVAIFNVQDPEETPPPGTVYLNGSALDSAATATAMEGAYQRFINDTYWLLAPLKAFDPGVNRAYAADSSTAETDVLHLTFGDVGLTPGDEYWLYIDRTTGRLKRWAFHLQSMPDDAAPRFFTWDDPVTLEGPGGEVTLPTRKPAAGGPVAIRTDSLAAPATLPEGAFSRSTPMLGAAR
jgi:hypothetical protein